MAVAAAWASPPARVAEGAAREPDRLGVRAPGVDASCSGSGSSRSSGRSCSRPRPRAASGPSSSVGLANYRELAHDPEWLDAVSRSLKFTLLYVPTTVLLGLGLALLLNQKIRFIGFYRTCFFVPFVASAAATGVIFLYVLDPQYGIVDNGLAWMGLHPPAVPRRPRLGALPARAHLHLDGRRLRRPDLPRRAAGRPARSDRGRPHRRRGPLRRVPPRDPAGPAADHRARGRVGDDQRAAVLRSRLDDQARRADRRDHGDHRLRLQARLRAGPAGPRRGGRLRALPRPSSCSCCCRSSTRGAGGSMSSEAVPSAVATPAARERRAPRKPPRRRPSAWHLVLAPLSLLFIFPFVQMVLRVADDDGRDQRLSAERSSRTTRRSTATAPSCRSPTSRPGSRTR